MSRCKNPQEDMNTPVGCLLADGEGSTESSVGHEVEQTEQATNAADHDYLRTLKRTNQCPTPKAQACKQSTAAVLHLGCWNCWQLGLRNVGNFGLGGIA